MFLNAERSQHHQRLRFPLASLYSEFRTAPRKSIMLFGQRLKLYGEMYALGEPVGHHPDGDDPGLVLARRCKIRTVAKQAVERYHARELVRRRLVVLKLRRNRRRLKKYRRSLKSLRRQIPKVSRRGRTCIRYWSGYC